VALRGSTPSEVSQMFQSIAICKTGVEVRQRPYSTSQIQWRGPHIEGLRVLTPIGRRVILVQGLQFLTRK
jgi:hypothetical protein